MCIRVRFDDDLIEEVIHLVLVVALSELGRLETLVDYVFRSSRHGFPPFLNQLRTVVQRLGNASSVIGQEYMPQLGGTARQRRNAVSHIPTMQHSMVRLQPKSNAIGPIASGGRMRRKNFS